MPDPSTSSPYVHRAAGRVAGRALRENRVARASWTAGSRVFSALSRVLHTFFLETMGLFFLLFSLIGAGAAYREYRAYQAGQVGMERAALGLLFALVFGYFAISSFWRARQRGKSQ